MIDNLKYWTGVLSRAFTDAFQFGKIHLTGTVLTLIGTTLAAWAFSYFRGWDAGYDKMLWYSLTTLASFGLVVLLATTVFLVRTPLLLQSEKVKELTDNFSTTEKDLTDKASLKEKELTSSIALLEERIKQSESQCQQKQDEIARLTEEVTKVRTNNPSINIKRSALKTIIAEYEFVIQQCQNRDKAAIEAFYTTDRKARNFIEKEAGDLSRFSGKLPFQDSHTTKAIYSPEDFEAIAERARYRLEFLRDFATHYG